MTRVTRASGSVGPLEPRSGAALFEPRSIAIVGASPDMTRFGGRPLANLEAHDYGGTVYPVNPKYSEVRGLRCFPSLSAIEGDVDAALLAIPAGLVPEALQECGARNVKLAVVVSSGFAELGGDGAQTQRLMVDSARAAGIRLLGPNCLGFYNVPDRIPAVATAAVDLPDVRPGGISMVSHSGALGIVSVFVRAHDNGVGYRFLVSSGNESDLHAVELMRMFVDDARTRVIAGLIEELRAPQDLAGVAEAALTAGKPIVVLKIGRSEGGTRAASAHTAALAGSDAVYDGSFRAHGIVRVDDLDELWQVPHLFASVPLPAGRRVGIMTTSGGLNGLLADLLHREGLDTPTLSPGTVDELRRALPPYAVTENPLDLTGGLGSADREVAAFAAALRLLDRDPRIDVIVLGQILVRSDHDESLGRILEVVESLHKPVVLLSPGGSIAEPGLGPAREFGIPVFTSPQRLARALGHLCSYADFVRAREAGRRDGRPGRAVRPQAPRALEPGLYDADATWRLLADYGLPVVRHERCAGVAEALAAADRIGYPVALKASGADLLHKTEAGGVVLGLRDPAALASAYEDMRGRLAGADLEVHEMVDGGVEMIVGIQHDPHFGPVVVAGSGGILVELVGDSALRVPPVDVALAHEMVAELRAMSMLRGFRGGPPADLDALADVIAGVSAIALDLAGTIDSLDLNPVIVLPAGRGARIVDAALLGRGGDAAGEATA
jgi:acyl-CoA synthetase (NDP forming)